MNYQKRKSEARDEAIAWQLKSSNENISTNEIIENNEHFTKLGKRYGLLKEFKENGII